jgi:hypothetical protein
MKTLVVILVLCWIAGSCTSEPPPQPTAVPTDALLPTSTPRPTHSPLPAHTPLPASTPTPEWSQADMEVLAAAWRFCLLGQVHADYAIERFSSDSPPDGSEVLALMTMPNAMRDYLRDEAQFPPQFEELRDRIVAELSAIAGAMFAVVDYPAAVKKLETRRDNLKEIQLEIEKIVPEHILMAEPSPTP